MASGSDSAGARPWAGEFGTALLRQLPLLRLLDDGLLAQAASVSRLVEYDKREPVAIKGVAGDWLGFLVAGKLQVVDTLANGREVGLNIIQTGSFFGELSVIDQQPRSASVVAIAASRVVQVPGSFARHLFYRHPSVAEAILLHLARSIRRTNELRSIQSIPNASVRIFSLLDFFKERSASGLTQIDNVPTHQEFALMANTSRETVTRALSELARRGVIRKDTRRLIIIKPEVLRKMGEEGDQDPLAAVSSRPWPRPDRGASDGG